MCDGFTVNVTDYDFDGISLNVYYDVIFDDDCTLSSGEKLAAVLPMARFSEENAAEGQGELLSEEGNIQSCVYRTTLKAYTERLDVVFKPNEEGYAEFTGYPYTVYADHKEPDRPVSELPGKQENIFDFGDVKANVNWWQFDGRNLTLQYDIDFGDTPCSDIRDPQHRVTPVGSFKASTTLKVFEEHETYIKMRAEIELSDRADSVKLKFMDAYEYTDMQEGKTDQMSPDAYRELEISLDGMEKAAVQYAEYDDADFGCRFGNTRITPDDISFEVSGVTDPAVFDLAMMYVVDFDGYKRLLEKSEFLPYPDSTDGLLIFNTDGIDFDIADIFAFDILHPSDANTDRYGDEHVFDGFLPVAMPPEENRVPVSDLAVDTDKCLIDINWLAFDGTTLRLQYDVTFKEGLPEDGRIPVIVAYGDNNIEPHTSHSSRVDMLGTDGNTVSYLSEVVYNRVMTEPLLIRFRGDPLHGGTEYISFLDPDVGTAVLQIPEAQTIKHDVNKEIPFRWGGELTVEDVTLCRDSVMLTLYYDKLARKTVFDLYKTYLVMKDGSRISLDAIEDNGGTSDETGRIWWHYELSEPISPEDVVGIYVNGECVYSDGDRKALKVGDTFTMSDDTTGIVKSADYDGFMCKAVIDALRRPRVFRYTAQNDARRQSVL